ncbi:general transcription factor 3C polypeptide 6 isoform X2 [Aricia agestis]|uniref:general transcription factor 3C polypeptide 6 isoform X2 n=1 Tax=Aricia agestis TaxID=91739 RepID=UPI001C20171E|nr:general transcription factor 3C polypeptide 6 isoform X2 [Aricia agestis]
MASENSDSEEEILVYAEFKDNINIDNHKNLHVLGIDTKSPVFQLDDTFYIGKFENPFGTYMFFGEDPSPRSLDPLFDKLPDKSLQYICKTRKFLTLQHALITPKEGTGSQIF